MYHIGKVVKIHRKREKELGIQATIDMWDENVLTADVDQKVATEMKEGKYVLVDYQPIPGLTIPQPRQVVARVLDDGEADDVWRAYKQRYDKLSSAAKPPSMPAAYR